MEFLTREFFDTLIFIVIAIGLVLAALRLYRDFTRPLPPDPRSPYDEAWLDTRETPVVEADDSRPTDRVQ